VFYVMFALLIVSRPAGLLLMTAWSARIIVEAFSIGEAGASVLYGT
jgi:hypothetical protein